MTSDVRTFRAYESTGKVTQFTNHLDPDPVARDVFTFHRPDELIRLATQERQLRLQLRAMPELRTDRLWRVQVEAIRNLEASLAAGKPLALIQMATGSGKTYTACSFCYRLIKYAHAQRILFLVDRNNLGKQTYNEFQQYLSPYSNYLFTEEFNVQRLSKNTVDTTAKVCITTIQRLYSILKGEPEFDEGNEDDSLFESENPLLRALSQKIWAIQLMNLKLFPDLERLLGQDCLIRLEKRLSRYHISKMNSNNF